MFNQPNVPFEDILLTPREKWILFSLRFCKSRKGDVFSLQLWKLKEYDLITQNDKNTRDKEGCPISNGTYSLTDKAVRFRIYRYKQFIHRYLTPIVVAFLTSIATNLLKELWLPELLDFLKGLP